jgi:phosphohistidine swiveling domain-containing protein
VGGGTEIGQAGALTVEHRCDDGTPFPVTFADPADARRTWRLEQQHSIGCQTPLAVALAPLSRRGGERAYAEAGLPFPSFWAEGPDAHGWPYFLDEPPAADEMSAITAGCAALLERYGGSLRIWRDLSLPKVREACAWLQSTPDATTRELSDAHAYAHHHTMISAMVAGNDRRLVADVLDGVVPDPDLTAHELAQGYANETIDADRRLWALGRAVRADDRLREALASADPSGAMDELREAGGHGSFFAELDAFLDHYGWRGELWCIDNPSWRERGPGFWAALRRFASDGARSPDDVLGAAAARRSELTARLAAAIDDDDRRARFLRRVERLADYVPVREERALWQLVATGSLRHAVLARAATLVDRGVIDSVDDVFFLLPAEVDAAEPVDRTTVAARREEHARWSSLRPPAAVGALPGGTTSPAGSGVLTGTAASRGVARGTARVIHDLAEADVVEPGDILVCPTTAPPWTPLFAVVAAVVTDTGDLGSHAAIAAREYGIPCVVAVSGATERIPDGAEVVVDAGAGTVELLA